MEKKCIRCNTVLNISEFYKHRAMGDGHLNKCKECCKAYTLKHRRENSEYYKEYDRIRGRTEERKKRNVDRYKLLKEIDPIKLKSLNKKRSDNWNKNNKHKKTAQQKCNRAIKKGIIIKPNSCTECNEPNEYLEAHHEDYSKPLEVKFLCTKCHGLTRRKEPIGKE